MEPTTLSSVADPDPPFRFGADLDTTFHFDADPDVNPAPPHQNDANLRPQVYSTGPSMAQFEPPRLNCERPGPSMAPFLSLHSSGMLTMIRIRNTDLQAL